MRFYHWGTSHVSREQISRTYSKSNGQQGLCNNVQWSLRSPLPFLEVPKRNRPCFVKKLAHPKSSLAPPSTQTFLNRCLYTGFHAKKKSQGLSRLPLRYFPRPVCFISQRSLIYPSPFYLGWPYVPAVRDNLDLCWLSQDNYEQKCPGWTTHMAHFPHSHGQLTPSLIDPHRW